MLGHSAIKTVHLGRSLVLSLRGGGKGEGRGLVRLHGSARWATHRTQNVLIRASHEAGIKKLDMVGDHALMNKSIQLHRTSRLR